MSGQGDKGIRWDWDGARRIGPFVLGQPLDDSVVRELGITQRVTIDDPGGVCVRYSSDGCRIDVWNGNVQSVWLKRSLLLAERDLLGVTMDDALAVMGPPIERTEYRYDPEATFTALTWTRSSESDDDLVIWMSFGHERSDSFHVETPFTRLPGADVMPTVETHGRRAAPHVRRPRRRPARRRPLRVDDGQRGARVLKKNHRNLSWDGARRIGPFTLGEPLSSATSRAWSLQRTSGTEFQWCTYSSGTIDVITWAGRVHSVMTTARLTYRGSLLTRADLGRLFSILGVPVESTIDYASPCLDLVWQVDEPSSRVRLAASSVGRTFRIFRLVDYGLVPVFRMSWLGSEGYGNRRMP